MHNGAGNSCFDCFGNWRWHEICNTLSGRSLRMSDTDCSLRAILLFSASIFMILFLPTPVVCKSFVVLSLWVWLVCVCLSVANTISYVTKDEWKKASVLTHFPLQFVASLYSSWVQSTFFRLIQRFSIALGYQLAVKHFVALHLCVCTWVIFFSFKRNEIWINVKVKEELEWAFNSFLLAADVTKTGCDLL